ncbi:putative polyketide synthase [Mycena floridula]|nr:putative polyketide synthase [Mycena floridula]
MLTIPVFAGQGIPTTNEIRQQGLRAGASPNGSILLSSCHAAFRAEISTLSWQQLERIGIDLDDFNGPETLLYDHDVNNPIISGSTLLLIQSLRYLTFIEPLTTDNSSLIDALNQNAEFGTGILGFSSGILPASVVATSSTVASFIENTVEAYRLALWIGIRMQEYRHDAREMTLPWSLVFLGMESRAAEEAIANFGANHSDLPSLHVTAVMDSARVTISGRPNVLSIFATEMKQYTAQVTSLDSLYHADLHIGGARELVLADIVRRDIHFPNYGDIRVPIRSSSTGAPLTNQTPGCLVQDIVEMILVQQVRWDLVIQEVLQTIPKNSPVTLVNVGPGTGLTRGLERQIPRHLVRTTNLGAPASATPLHEPIAIVGMAIHMPGASNTAELWKILEEGIDTIAEIPEYRFKVSDYNSGKNPQRHMKAHTGNFIDGVDEFDNTFFKISPREAKSMDPQQRILLHTAYQAMEDAGYVPNATSSFRPEAFGCFIGAATNDYVQNLQNDIDVYYSTGNLKAFLSGRISYAFQLSGPSIVVDTACSSSNIALYQGARALRNGDCNAALVGGVNVISSPDMFLGLDRGHFLSPTGQCKAFDASADGYSRSEGCGMFVLKRLSDAISECDNIRGVIRGIEVNNSGLSHSITHPHSPTQALLFQRVLETSGVDPSRINVVEAHGTGTQAGDPNELRSIRSVLAKSRAPSNPLYITSIKANIGHLEAASGAAGLAKLLLMFQHRSIPRQILLNNLNRNIDPLWTDNTVISTTQIPWSPSHEGQTRMALLNNFGAAGSNSALIVEEYRRDQPETPLVIQPFVFGLSAKTPSALEALRSRYLEWLDGSEAKAISFGDLAYTMTARRQQYRHRMAIAASNLDELRDKLTHAVACSVDGSGKIGFVFSGQGGQYIGMGRSLYLSSSLFKAHIDECHDILIAAGFRGIMSVILGDEAADSSSQFEAYQSSLFALQYALAKLWISWGLVPTVLIGHSLGEYAGLVIAKVMSLRAALMMVANRARLMVEKCSPETTGMMAVNLSAESAQHYLSSIAPSKITISCYNSSVDCVVSGPQAELEMFKDFLDTEVHCKNTILAVPFGYHSAAMTPIVAEFVEICSAVTFHAPTIPVVSNLHGQLVLPGDSSVFNAEYFARHCIEAVRFTDGIYSLLATPEYAELDAWIEIGPHSTTLPMLKSIRSFPSNTQLIGSLRKQRDAMVTLTSSLVQLYLSNVDIRWRQPFSHIPSISCMSLPSYPFAKSRFWIPYKEMTASTISEPSSSPVLTRYPMLHAWTQKPSNENQLVSVFETPIARLADSIVGHTVGGVPLCPASVYLEQIYAGIALSTEYLEMNFEGNAVILRDLKFPKPLVYDKKVKRIVIVTLNLREGNRTFTVSSRASPDEEESIHVFGTFRWDFAARSKAKLERKLPVITAEMDSLMDPAQEREVFSTRTIYEVIFPRVVQYSREYQTIQSLIVDATSMQGCALVRLPSGYSTGPFVVHPVFTDTLLHLSGFLANMQGNVNDAYICSELGSAKVMPHLVDTDAEFRLYCSNIWLPDEGIILAQSWAVTIKEPRRVVAHFKDMQFRRVKLNSLKRMLGQAAGLVTLARSRRFSQITTASSPQSSRPSSPQMEPESTGQTEVDVETSIMKMVAETCDVALSAFDSSTSLDSLGVDSLMLIEILTKLQLAFPETYITPHSLAFCKTTAEIVLEINAARSSLTPPVTAVSSPRTLVADEKLAEPMPFLIDGAPDIKELIASVLDLKPDELTDDTTFEALGLDSLTSIEVLHTLRTRFHLDLPNDFFYLHPRISAVKRFLSFHYRISTKNKRLEDLPRRIQKSDLPNRLPLFLIHDGSGLATHYDRLSDLGRSVWSIQNPHFLSAQPWDSVIEMASSYAEGIASVTVGPVILGGWSFGGVAAYETAFQLSKRGIIVKGLLLIDSPSPINHVPLSAALIESAAGSRDSATGRLVQAQFAMNSALLGQYNPAPMSIPIVLLRSSQGYNPLGVVNVPSWISDRRERHAGDWDSLTDATVKILDIPGHHFEAFDPCNITSVSLRIVEGCTHLDEL